LLCDGLLLEEDLAAILLLEGGGRKGAIDVALERWGCKGFARGEERLLAWLLALERKDAEGLERNVCCHCGRAEKGRREESEGTRCEKGL
jgi:hypothetical protein